MRNMVLVALIEKMSVVYKWQQLLCSAVSEPGKSRAALMQQRAALLAAQGDWHLHIFQQKFCFPTVAILCGSCTLLSLNLLQSFCL